MLRAKLQWRAVCHRMWQRRLGAPGVRKGAVHAPNATGGSSGRAAAEQDGAAPWLESRLWRLYLAVPGECMDSPSGPADEEDACLLLPLKYDFFSRPIHVVPARATERVLGTKSVVCCGESRAADRALAMRRSGTLDIICRRRPIKTISTRRAPRCGTAE